MMMIICFDRYYKTLIRTKATTSPISLPARQTVFQLKLNLGPNQDKV